MLKVFWHPSDLAAGGASLWERRRASGEGKRENDEKCEGLKTSSVGARIGRNDFDCNLHIKGE
jgi:hypothetical protein